MADYSSLASDFDEAPAKSGPAPNLYSDLASEFNTAPKQVNKKAPTFQTNDPASMRRQLVAAGDANVVAAFDKQYPGYAPHDSIGGGRGITPASAFATAPATATKTAAPTKGADSVPWWQPSKPGDEFLANQVSGTLSSIAGGYRGMATVANSMVHGSTLDQAIDAGAKAVTDTQQTGTYQPRSAGGQKMVDAFSSNYNPLNWPGVAGRYVGDKLADAGLPGTGAAVDAALTTSPMLLGLKGPRATVGDVVDNVTGKARPVQIAGRIEPTMDGSGTPAPQQAGQGTPTTATPATQPGGTSKAPVPGVSPTPAAAQQVTPTEALKSGQQLPKAEQMLRAQALQDVGFTQSRDAAIRGDHRARAVEYQMSKFDEPAGQAAAQQFSSEVQTLGDYTRGLIEKSGGTVGTDQGALYARGQSIVRPVQALRDWFDQKASALYQAADQTAQGQPVSLDGFGSTLRDQSFWTNADRVGLKDAALAYARKAGMQVGDDGSITGTALQAETVRKWLNQERTSANGRFVDALKDSLDGDVSQSAGGQVYAAARQLWQQRQATLGDPKGISSLLDEEGTNRAVPFERVPENVARLPQDQFAHIVSTLQHVPPELQGVANQALGEIKAQFYNKMLDGASSTRGGNGRPFWNGAGVRNVIRDNAGKLQVLLSPDEMKSLTSLQRAGDILSFDPSYPGAAAQAQAAMKHGLMSNVVGHTVTGVGAVAGAALGAPGTGAVLGRAAAERAQAAVAQRQALSGWKKGSVNLRDIMNGP